MNGKGSIPRPFSVTLDEFRSSYDRIFGQKEKNPEPGGKSGATTGRETGKPTTAEDSPG